MAEADAGASDGGALSVDQAVGALREARSEPAAGADGAQGAPDGEAGAEAPEASTDTDLQPPEEVDGGEDTQPGDGEDASLEPPQFWKAEWKEQFATFPKDVQEILVSQEKERDTLLSTATTKANTARAELETEAKAIAERKTQIDELLPRAKAIFKGRWEGVDWNAVTDQYGAEETLKLQNLARTDLAELQRLEKAQREAEATEFSTFVTREREALKTEAPELVDPKEGQARRQSVVKFLGENGYDPQQIRGATAKQIAIAYDAMRYRQLKGSTVAKDPKSAATPPRPTLRPSAATSRSPQREVEAARAKVDGTGSVDDGVALLRAQRKR